MAARYADGRAVLAGAWGSVRLTGSDTVTVDGFVYAVPAESEMKIVRTVVGQVVHVKHDGRVDVLHRGRQLIESEDAARERARPVSWGAIAK